MAVRFPSFTRAFIRILEIAGAGLTSALVAYLLGRTEPPPPVPPPVVHLAPADEEMIRTVRSDQAALLDQLRTDAQARKTPAGPIQANAAQADAAEATPAEAAPVQTAATQSVSTTPAQATPAQAALAQGAQLAQIASAAPVMPQVQVTVPQFPTMAVPEVAVSATDIQSARAPQSSSVPQNVSAPAKPAKASQQSPSQQSPSQQVAARRETKPERLHLAEPKVRAEPRVAVRSVTRVEPRADELQARSPAGPVNVAVVPATAPVPVAPAEQNDTDSSNMGLVAALKGFTTRLLPSRDRVPAPDQGAMRPPMPVGELQQSAMSGGMSVGPRSGVSDF
jgi:hypothetical protein